ncbi:MAG: SMP-30/gluconolactonase/LRE family protein [Halieaceae bacterium]|nr:SMP-30/gluconolactonase/LRE family protein [Halieaceae bacterium]
MRTAFIALALLLAGHAWADAPPADCDPVDGITSICGLVAPEDIELLPGGRYLVFSQMQEGLGLSLLDSRDDSVRPLYPPGATQAEPSWGDAACPPRPADRMLLHGIHLARRADGRLQVLAVNHGGRESVEFFEILEPRQDLPVALWRGCVLTPEPFFFNDVVGLSDGGFLATNMYDRNAQAWDAIRALFGYESGNVQRWRPSSGFETVPGTAARVPNGIAIAPDEKHFYLNAYLGSEVGKYKLDGGNPVTVLSIARPDNSAWDSRGRLLVASHDDRLRAIVDGIPGSDGGPVDLRFRIIAIDPESHETEVVLEREGAPMGGGTVAVDAAGHLYIGSYAGDRIIKFPLTIEP